MKKWNRNLNNGRSLCLLPSLKVCSDMKADQVAHFIIEFMNVACLFFRCGILRQCEDCLLGFGWDLMAICLILFWCLEVYCFIFEQLWTKKTLVFINLHYRSIVSSNCWFGMERMQHISKAGFSRLSGIGITQYARNKDQFLVIFFFNRSCPLDSFRWYNYKITPLYLLS